MKSSCAESRIINFDFSQLAADDASNATGSIQEFEVLTRAGLSNAADFAVCYAHQNERLDGKASGTVKFAEVINDELGDVLKKSHEIQVRIGRAPKRLHIYQLIQNKKDHKPLLTPNPANETRWNGCIDEIIHANLIMADICDTVYALLEPEDDYNPLTTDEKEPGDKSHLSYTEDNKKIL